MSVGSMASVPWINFGYDKNRDEHSQVIRRTMCRSFFAFNIFYICYVFVAFVMTSFLIYISVKFS